MRKLISISLLFLASEMFVTNYCSGGVRNTENLLQEEDRIPWTTDLSSTDRGPSFMNYLHTIGKIDQRKPIKASGAAWNNFSASLEYNLIQTKIFENIRLALQLDKKNITIKDEGSKLSAGAVFKDLGLYEKAIDYYKKSVQTKKKLGDSDGEAKELNNLGQTYYCSGDYTMALDFFEQSLLVYRNVGKAEGEGAALRGIGDSYRNLGNNVRALEYFKMALDTTKATDPIRDHAILLNEIGILYKSLGLYSKAIEYFELSISKFRKSGDYIDQAHTLLNIGETFLQMGKYDEAIKSTGESLEVLKKAGDPTQHMLYLIANDYLDAGNISGAELLIKETEDSSTLGRLALLRSDYLSALTYYTRHEKLVRETGNTRDLFTACTGLGKTYEGMRDYLKAQEFYERATKISEEMWSNLTPSERKNFFQAKVNGFQISDPAKGLTRVRIRLNDPDGSLESSELLRSWSFACNLIDGISVGSTGVPQSVMSKEQSLVNKVASLKRELGKTDKKTQTSRYDILSNETNRAVKNWEDFKEDLWKKYPAYAAVRYYRPAKLKDAPIGPEEYIIIFDVFDDGIGVKLVHDKKISKIFFREWPRDKLENDLKRYRESLGTGKALDFDVGLGSAIYRKLMYEVMDGIPNGTPIIIIPDGILALLPFEALVVSENSSNYTDKPVHHPDSIGFLGFEHPISYYQSMTALTLARTSSNKPKPETSTLVIADPVFSIKDERAHEASGLGIPEDRKNLKIELLKAIKDCYPGFGVIKHLPDSSVLAQRLCQILPGNCLALTGTRANKLDFMTQVAPKLIRYGNVIFATHGIMSRDFPVVMEPFLALTMIPPGTDGFLTLSDILSQNMNADIVALTACHTDITKTDSGQSLMNMGRAFQYAGAKSVLMTLWEVDDFCSVKLTERFFLHRKNGKRKLDALQEARSDIRNEGFKHPYFWCGFILVGEQD